MSQTTSTEALQPSQPIIAAVGMPISAGEPVPVPIAGVASIVPTTDPGQQVQVVVQVNAEVPKPEKSRHRKKWTNEEDELLKMLVDKHGKKWSIIASHIPSRDNGCAGQKRCRERYINHLDPKLNKGVWTQAEDVKLKELFEEHGPQWRLIASQMSDRSEISVKNRCNTRLKKHGVKPGNKPTPGGVVTEGGAGITVAVGMPPEKKRKAEEGALAVADPTQLVQVPVPQTGVVDTGMEGITGQPDWQQLSARTQNDLATGLKGTITVDKASL